MIINYQKLSLSHAHQSIEFQSNKFNKRSFQCLRSDSIKPFYQSILSILFSSDKRFKFYQYNKKNLIFLN